MATLKQILKDVFSIKKIKNNLKEEVVPATTSSNQTQNLLPNGSKIVNGQVVGPDNKPIPNQPSLIPAGAKIINGQIVGADNKPILNQPTNVVKNNPINGTTVVSNVPNKNGQPQAVGQSENPTPQTPGAVVSKSGENESDDPNSATIVQNNKNPIPKKVVTAATIKTEKKKSVKTNE